MQDHDKRRIALWYWLQGAGWNLALEAFEFASRYHVGLRKNGNPEFSHQIDIAHHVRTLPGLIRPQETLCIALLHDVREDFGVSDDEIRNPFGPLVADGVERMTKVFRGDKKRPEDYFGEIAKCPMSSIAKGADRIHNLNDMEGAFSLSKQAEYTDEGERWFLPMLKEARRLHPRQEPAYQNLRLTLGSQIRLVRSMIAASQAG